MSLQMHGNAWLHTAMHGNALQSTATHRNDLQRTASHCSTISQLCGVVSLFILSPSNPHSIGSTLETSATLK